jgi:hypothetical protein
VGRFVFFSFICITDEFVSEFKELIIKVECIKYATLVITKISKGNNLENLDNSSYSTLNTRQKEITTKCYYDYISISNNNFAM